MTASRLLLQPRAPSQPSLVGLWAAQQEEVGRRMGRGHPFPASARSSRGPLPTFMSPQVCLQSWLKSLSKEEWWAPGPRPARHPAPCRPFQKHLLVEATGSRLLCRGSQAGQLRCSLTSCWWGGWVPPSRPVLRPEGPFRDHQFLVLIVPMGDSPERECDLPKTTEQFRVEVGSEPGAPSVFLRNQQDCPWRRHGQTGAAQGTGGPRLLPLPAWRACCAGREWRRTEGRARNEGCRSRCQEADVNQNLSGFSFSELGSHERERASGLWRQSNRNRRSKWLRGRGLRREPLVFFPPVCPVSFQCLAPALLPRGAPRNS